MCVRFRPPTLVEIVTAEGRAFGYYSIPVRRGVVRTIAISVSARPRLLRTPVWLDHWRRNRLVEGDLDLLLSQELHMKRTASRPELAYGEFVMPTKSDTLVVELTTWLRRFSPVGHTWYGFEEAKGEAARMRTGDEAGLRLRSVVHTQLCKSCSQMVESLQRVQNVALLSAVVNIFVQPFLQEGDVATACNAMGILSALVALACWQWRERVF